MSSQLQQTEIGWFPLSWEINRIDSAFDIQQGKQVSSRNRAGEHQRPFLRTKNVFWNHLDLSDLDEMHFSEAEQSRLKLRANDLLVCEGGSIGRTALWNNEVNDCLYQNHLHRLRQKGDKADPQFTLYWLWYAFDIAKLYFGRGNVTTIPNLSQSKLAELPMAFPPLSEQKGIAHTLDTVQQVIKAQERIIQTTTEPKQALMQKLFSEGLRGEPQKETEIGLVPESWEVVECGDVCESISVGIVVQPSSYYVKEGVPAFRSQNVRADRLHVEPLVYISNEANDGPVKKSKLSAGDVLIVRTGYPGTSCVVPPEFEGSNCIDLIFARPDKARLSSHYLSRFFNSDLAKRQVQAGKTGLAQQHYNVAAVKNTKIPLPSREQQEEIGLYLQLFDSKIDTTESRAASLHELFRTLLHDLMTARAHLRETILSY